MNAWNRRRISLFGIVSLAFGLWRCGPSEPECMKTNSCPAKPPPFSISGQMRDGKRFLGTFEGERARGVFQRVVAYYEKKPEPGFRTPKKDRTYCEAKYGVVLADGQRFFSNLNALIGLVIKAVAGSGGLPLGAPVSLRPQAKASLDIQPGDYIFALENKWSSLEAILQEMAVYSEQMTTISVRNEIADCGFSIGVEKDERQNEAFKYVLRLGNDHKPLIEIQFRGRFDANELRLVSLLTRSLLGSADFVLSHDGTLTLNVAKILYQLGLPDSCIDNNVVKLECLVSLDLGNARTILQRVPGWAFIFQDNPRLLAKSSVEGGCSGSATTSPTCRWEYRFKNVDNHLMLGFRSMLDFFDSLVKRNLDLKGLATRDEVLGQYILIYKDRGNDKVDGSDVIGLNIAKVLLSPEYLIDVAGMESSVAGRQQADLMRSDWAGLEATINGTGLPFLRNLPSPSESVVDSLRRFFQRMHDNMKAVDNPGYPHERIPINTFDDLMLEMLQGVLINDRTPNWLEFDLANYFINPRPLRDYIPYWQLTTGYTGAAFLIDGDSYWVSGTWATMKELVFDRADFLDLRWVVFWPDYLPNLQVQERSLFGGTFNGGTRGTLAGIDFPADCVNAKSLTSTIRIANRNQTFGLPVLALNFPDPSFNGMVYVDLEVWNSLNSLTSFGATTCNDAVGFDLASNYSLTKATWQYVRFLWENFLLKDALPIQPILDQLR